MNRIVGLETEYGCLTTDPSGPPSAVGRVRNWIFDRARYGLPDMHQRDWDEPAGNGGFLFNGGRAYVDMGHLEYCTPECLSLIDVLRYDRAGDAILLQAVKDLRLNDQVSFIRNNIDHYSGATFGCHENYLMKRELQFSPRLLGTLLYQVKPGDPVVIAGIGALLGAAAIAASLVPGTRATRVDPITVLRAE